MVKYFLQVFLNIFIERELKKIFKDEPFDYDNFIRSNCDLNLFHCKTTLTVIDRVSRPWKILISRFILHRHSPRKNLGLSAEKRDESSAR